MRLAIISDTHDNIPNLKKVLNYCQKNKITQLIHCGDLAEIETLNFIQNNFTGTIFWTFGNMDLGHSADYPFTDNKYSAIHIFSKHGEIEIANKKIAFVHFPEYAKKLALSNRFDFVFYGHTHKPWEEMIGNCKLLNPGNVANQIYQPTFAVWDSLINKFQLIVINQLTE